MPLEPIPLALKLAVLGVILGISFDQGLDPAPSVGIRIGLEIVYFSTVVGALVLDLMHKNRVNNIPDTRMPKWMPWGLTWFM